MTRRSNEQIVSDKERRVIDAARVRVCPDCGYDLQGLERPLRCPECGLYIDVDVFFFDGRVVASWKKTALNLSIRIGLALIVPALLFGSGKIKVVSNPFSAEIISDYSFILAGEIAFFVLIFLFIRWRMGRFRIVVSPSGIQWRGYLRRWKKIEWRDVVHLETARTMGNVRFHLNSGTNVLLPHDAWLDLLRPRTVTDMVRRYYDESRARLKADPDPPFRVSQVAGRPPPGNGMNTPGRHST